MALWSSAREHVAGADESSLVDRQACRQWCDLEGVTIEKDYWAGVEIWSAASRSGVVK